jgi:hypothetical protein
MQILCVYKWCARERFAPTANKKAAEYSLLNTASKKVICLCLLWFCEREETFWPKINIQVASYCYYHTLASAVYRHPLFSHSTACIFFNKSFCPEPESKVIARSARLSYRQEESLRINSLLISYSKFILGYIYKFPPGKRIHSLARRAACSRGNGMNKD